MSNIKITPDIYDKVVAIGSAFDDPSNKPIRQGIYGPQTSNEWGRLFSKLAEDRTKVPGTVNNIYHAVVNLWREIKREKGNELATISIPSSSDFSPKNIAIQLKTINQIYHELKTHHLWPEHP